MMPDKKRKWVRTCDECERIAHELVKTAAVCAAWLEAIMWRDYKA